LDLYLNPETNDLIQKMRQLSPL